MPRIGYQKRKFKTIIMLDDGTLTWSALSAASVYPFGMKVTGDTNYRFRIRADGQLEWGGGAGALDIILYRSSANNLRLDDNLMMGATYVWFLGAAGNAVIVYGRALGDTVDAFELDNRGKLEWGPGNAAIDCVLSRRAANILNTPDRMEVGTLGVSNSAAGNTLGNLVKAVEVFDVAGASLGKIPVYDDITQV